MLLEISTYIIKTTQLTNLKYDYSLYDFDEKFFNIYKIIFSLTVLTFSCYFSFFNRLKKAENCIKFSLKLTYYLVHVVFYMFCNLRNTINLSNKLNQISLKLIQIIV